MAIALLALCRPGMTGETVTGCENRGLYEEIMGQAVTWTTLVPGTQLNSWDAVLTCRDSRVILLANRRFGHAVAWERAETGYRGTIPPEVFVVLHPWRQEPSIAAEVRDVMGKAFYSRDREIFQAFGAPSEGRSGTETDAWVIEQRRQDAEMYKALRRIPWVPLAEGNVLGPWDMLWTRPSGRVEIEILGHNGLIGGGTDVLDKDGRPTGRKRFPSDTYWVLHPDVHNAARATRVLGEVWRSTDPDQVRRFFQTYLTYRGTARDPAVERAEREAESQLRREDPDAYERWWAEHVRENHARSQQWLDSLRGGELE